MNTQRHETATPAIDLNAQIGRILDHYYEDDDQALEAIRQLVEQDPHRALLAQAELLEDRYSERSLQYIGPDGHTRTQFATSSDRTDAGYLNNVYVVVRDDDKKLVAVQVTHRPVEHMGYQIVATTDGILRVSTVMPGYEVAMDPTSRTYHATVRDVAQHGLQTARIVEHRRRHAPEAAMLADQQALAKLQASAAA